MYEYLKFVQKITNSQFETPDPFPGVCRDYKRGYETGEVGCQYWPPEYWCYTYSLKHCMMGVVFKPHRLKLDDLDPGQAGRQDPTESIPVIVDLQVVTR